MNVEGVCTKFSKIKIGIKISVKKETVFIEGTADTLKFLGNIF